MAAPARKYNPGFLADDDLVDSFCVRNTEFDLLVEALRGCTGASNPHQIVIGPRGSGKTTLLLRVAAEARRDAALAARCFPVVFAEESYEVSSAGEFWLECLTHLAAQAAPYREGEPDLERTVGELRALRDDRDLGDRCLGALFDFADRRGQRLLLLVENLNMLFRDMADPDAGWRLRKVLQTEPRIILFASATSRFAEIDSPDSALYDLFRVRTLRPLDTKQCAALWESVAGPPAEPGTVRPLEILTGGSPRLIAIVARFGTGRSFRKLMAGLLDLVDDHTEYFKSHLESLPAQERRVYLALAALWKPATTREIAEHARLEPSQCSAHLARLGERGAVQVAGGSARRKQYYLTERLYNIYYLLRRRGGPDRVVEALVRFMESYYSPQEMMAIGENMVNEIDNLDAEAQSLHRTALVQLVELPALASVRAELVAKMPAGLRPVTPAAQAAREFFEAKFAMCDPERFREDTLAACEKMVLLFGKNEDPTVQELVAKALVNKGHVLLSMQRPDEAMAACEEAVRGLWANPTLDRWEIIGAALVNKGLAFGALQQLDDGLATFDEVVCRFGTSETPALQEIVAKALLNKGIAVHRMQRLDDAVAAYDDIVRRFGTNETPALQEIVAKALLNKGIAVHHMQRLDDAVAAYDDIVRRFGTSGTSPLQEIVAEALFRQGTTPSRALRSPDNAVAAYDEVVRRFGTSEKPALQGWVAKALLHRGITIGVIRDTERFFPTDKEALRRYEDPPAAFDKVVLRFGASKLRALQELVAEALVRKGNAFDALQRPDDALAAYDEVVRRFGMISEPGIVEAVAFSLGEKARLEFEHNQFKAAIETVGQLLYWSGAELREPATMARAPELATLFYRSEAESREATVRSRKLRGHLIRAKAAIAEGNSSTYDEDIRAILKIVPELDSLPKEVLDTLMDFSVELGSQRVHELITESRAATLLRPLLAALEQELGLKSRVPREVKEVASDIRRELARRRAPADRGDVTVEGKRP